MNTKDKSQRKPRAIRSGNGKGGATPTANGNRESTRKPTSKKLVVEMYGGEPYEYYPLGKYVVTAQGVCDGHPTLKYTRIEVVPVLEAIAKGWTVKKVVDFYHRAEVTEPAVREAVRLAYKALLQVSSIVLVTA